MSRHFKQNVSKKPLASSYELTASDSYCLKSGHYFDKQLHCIIELFALCKGGNFNVHIWAWFSNFIC